MCDLCGPKIRIGRIHPEGEVLKAGDEVRVRELATLQRRRDLGSDLVRSAFSPRGAREIVMLAVSRNGSDTKFEDLDLDPTTTLWQLA